MHRPHVAGIAARENEGAFSIVLSGGYEDDVVSALVLRPLNFLRLSCYLVPISFRYFFHNTLYMYTYMRFLAYQASNSILLLITCVCSIYIRIMEIRLSTRVVGAEI